MKLTTHYLKIIFAATLCALVPSCSLASDEIVVRGGSSNVKQKLILAPQAGSMDDLTRGLSKYDSGDFKAALVEINKAILKDPQNTQAYFYRGLVRENLGDYVNAVSDFEQNRVAAFDPIILSEKGFCLTDMYELPAAMGSLNSSLAQDHSSADAALAFARRACVKRLMRNNPDAINDCNQALKLVPNHVEAKWQRAVTYCAMRKYQDALPDLQFVVQAAPRFANAHFTLAECFRVMDRPDEALAEYKKALALYIDQNDGHGKQSAQAKIAETDRDDKIVIMLRALSLLLIAGFAVSIASPCNSAETSKSSKTVTGKQQKSTLVGLVLAYSGDWILENGKTQRLVKARGLSVYEGELPQRTSKDGSLTVACMNNTTAICPGNHKIGEPFLLSEVEQVDDWWMQLLPFLSNYGGWIYPANRSTGGTVSLNDAVICVPGDKNAMNMTDVLSNLPDGAYQAEITEVSENAKTGKKSVKVDILKKDGGASFANWNALFSSGSKPSEPGVYTFRILTGPATAKIDWSSLEPALIEIVDSGKYHTHNATLQMAINKTESWNNAKQRSARSELIRALIWAQSKAPGSAYPQAFKDKPN